MSLMPKFPGSEYMPSCDEECEPVHPGWRLLEAFVGGAAPVVAAFTLNRLFGRPTEPDDTEEEE